MSNSWNSCIIAKARGGQSTQWYASCGLERLARREPSVCPRCDPLNRLAAACHLHLVWRHQDDHRRKVAPPNLPKTLRTKKNPRHLLNLRQADLVTETEDTKEQVKSLYLKNVSELQQFNVYNCNTKRPRVQHTLFDPWPAHFNAYMISPLRSLSALVAVPCHRQAPPMAPAMLSKSVLTWPTKRAPCKIFSTQSCLWRCDVQRQNISWFVSSLKWSISIHHD